ncbi:MAG: DUF368 domain-containing protein [Lachnospiraceae bacterium]|nr:DUF368 domain-containing protein [Lachnospiraceae bacterium]
MNFLVSLIKGVFVGIANIIPGVSGGTMAVSFGIYDKMLSAISNLFKDFKNSFRTLFPIAIGMVFGIVGFTFIIPWLLENQPLITSFAFSGLILGGVPMIIKELKSGWKRDEKKSLPVNVILFIILTTIAAILPFINGDKESGSLLTANPGTIVIMFFIGIIAAATMVIPGVSGSLVLMILGYYFGVITAVKDCLTALKDFDLAVFFDRCLVLAPFAIGCIIGIFFISKLIKWLFEHYSSATFSSILGLIVVSPLAIFYKVNEEYGLAGTNIIQIIIGIIIFALCTALTLYMGNLENTNEEGTTN